MSEKFEEMSYRQLAVKALRIGEDADIVEGGPAAAVKGFAAVVAELCRRHEALDAEDDK